MVTSPALADWQIVRTQRLDNLVSAHRAVTGGARGRPRALITEEINHALIVRLASEFQGFCRHVHDLSLAALLSGVQLAPGIEGMIKACMTAGRRLDTGNPSWSNIIEDFAPFAVSLKAELNRAHPTQYKAWVGALGFLLDARNAIAHDDRQKLDNFKTKRDGRPRLNLATFRQWKKMLDGLAAGVDGVMYAYLKGLTGRDPW